MRLVLIGIALLLAILSGSVQAEPHILGIVGDSTVCDYPPESPVRGWGQYVGEHLGPEIRVVNLAASGRSSKTFLREGRWARMLAEKPEVVLIQFGHNDSHGADKPEATDAATDYAE